jgi:hypothetical protein
MKKIILFLTALTLSATAGTMRNPTQIESGETYRYKADNKENIFYFYISGTGSFYAKTTRQNVELKTMFMKPTMAVHDIRMNKICNNRFGEDELNCKLPTGKYFLQIDSHASSNQDLILGEFTTYSSSIPSKDPKIIIKFKE